jgi:hypothetical protein
VRLAGISQFVNDSKMFGGAIAFGATNGAFSGAYVGRTSLDDVDESATNYGAHIGFSAPLDAARKVEICPIATADRISANFDFGLGAAELTGTRYGVGLAFGGIAGSGPTLDFVPFASLAYNHATSESSFGGTTDKTSDDFGILTLGAGLVLNKVFTIQPNVAIPFGIENEDPVYGITIAFSLGKKK